MLSLLLALALARAPLVAQPAGPAWSAWPASGTVTSPFGYDAGRRHPGIDIGDFSYADAAQILEIPIGTVMSRLHRGRRILKSQLAEQAVSA